ncbi:MAG: PQQ-binding-like beta-propeller repeat protein [Bryobacteraceae bacterium]
MKRFAATATVLVATLVPAFPQSGAPQTNFVPVTDQMIEKPDPGDWLMWRRTQDSWGYSPLTQITKANVSKLKMIWTRGMGPGLMEATPLAYRGTVYLPNPSDLIHALNGATGDLLWEYRRPLPEDIAKIFPVPSIHRNIAIYGDQIIDTSADDFVYAVDAKSGKLTWENRIVDYRENSAQETSGPIIAAGKIISGRGCEPKGGPDACVITAHDAKTGKEIWRVHTIPKPGEPGNETWGDIPYEQRKHVGAWMVPSYDPELHLIYIGTSVTSPAPKFMLAGNDKKYLYHNCTLALDVNTGKMVWYYQHIVDHWDFDHPFERYLIDTVVAPDKSEVLWINPKIKPGERRKVVTGIPGKTGIVYTLDRQTGEFLWATPTVKQNVVTKIDGATGEVTVNPETTFSHKGEERYVCPSTSGGKDWEAGAYSPLNNVMYFPLQNACMTVTPISDKPVPNSLYAITTKLQFPEGEDKLGVIQAISVETGKTLWKYEQRAGMMSLVATGSGLLFAGDSNGHFRAFDQNTGKVLWEVNLGSPVSGFPITYMANGKQYVAVCTGNALLTGGLNRLTPELHPSNSNAIFVFALGE